MIKIRSLINFLKFNFFINEKERRYISFNKSKWKNYKINSKNKILIDLFPFSPWMHFYSFIVNILSKKLEAEASYFYFDLYQGRQGKISLFISKLKSIYRSFNVTEGLSEYKFVYTKKDLQKYNKKFSNINYNSIKLINYKYKGIKIGDLIYDTYLRINYTPTIDIKDDKLKKIFFRAHKILDEIEKYFKIYKVKCVIPSHVCYINFGIISRYASKRKIPIIKIFSKNRGNAAYRLLKVDKKYILEEPPYFDYKRTFSKFTKKQKEDALKIGKKLIKKRTSGYFDKSLPYMQKSSFNNVKTKINYNPSKKKVVIFPHCYFDNPHRYRNMIFQDFYKQVNFFLNLSKKMKHIEWFYKPHPNELKSELNVHTDILKNYPHVKYLDKDVSHKSILKMKPDCVVTNHGTLSHEYAYYNIPVINTGDNPHINYDFCLHLSRKKQIYTTLKNIKKIKSKINFNKKKIHEYMYLHYEYFPNLNNEKKYLKDEYFAFKDIRKNTSSKMFDKFINQKPIVRKKIINYITEFVDKNI